MHVIPWYTDIEQLSTGEYFVLLFMIFIATVIAGFIIHAIARDMGFGLALNAILAFIGAFSGIYLRYRLLSPFGANDLALTIGCALAMACLLFFGLALIRARVF
jgi:uncharacterized membrane protein YeaQ/YmgE (transglycosylase-associated protein family)